MLVTQVAVFLQCLMDDRFQLRWNLPVNVRRWFWILVQDRAANFPGARPVERHLASRHLVQYGSEGEQVGACVELLGLNLLRRHIGHRT
jgi:hypothetical protein